MIFKFVYVEVNYIALVSVIKPVNFSKKPILLLTFHETPSTKLEPGQRLLPTIRQILIVVR